MRKLRTLSAERDVPVPGIFHILGGNIGTGIGKNGTGKSLGTSIGKSIGIGIVQHFGYRHKLIVRTCDSRQLAKSAQLL